MDDHVKDVVIKTVTELFTTLGLPSWHFHDATYSLARNVEQIPVYDPQHNLQIRNLASKLESRSQKSKRSLVDLQSFQFGNCCFQSYFNANQCLKKETEGKAF